MAREYTFKRNIDGKTFNYQEASFTKKSADIKANILRKEGKRLARIINVGDKHDPYYLIYATPRDTRRRK
jgi:hypothetical protein